MMLNDIKELFLSVIMVSWIFKKNLYILEIHMDTFINKMIQYLKKIKIVVNFYFAKGFKIFGDRHVCIHTHAHTEKYTPDSW